MAQPLKMRGSLKDVLIVANLVVTHVISCFIASIEERFPLHRKEFVAFVNKHFLFGHRNYRLWIS